AYELVLVHFLKKFNFNKKKTQTTLGFHEQNEIIFISKFSTYSLIQLHINLNSQQPSKKIRYMILEYLMRKYPGILSQGKPVSEFLIARELDKPVKKVRKTLRELHEEGYIRYKDQSIKQISFLTPRETNFLQNNLWGEFEKIQGMQWRRLQEMIYYAEQKEICREKLLLRYFGNQNAENCGKCDVCHSGSKTTDSNTLLRFLEGSPKTLPEILQHFINSPKESVLKSLQELMDEERITAVGIDSYKKK